MTPSPSFAYPSWRPGRPDRYTWVIIALVGLLILFRSRSLDLPYYWDEAWVYAPAVNAMGQHGPSLLPTALPPELSRGHPVLFHAAASSWSLVFGSTRTSLHAFQLAMACLVLFLTYAIGRQVVSPAGGLAAALLVAVNEMFLAQAAILLPEMLLTLLVLAALHCFQRRHAPWFVLFASAALLTKESALVLVCATFAWQAVSVLSVPEGGSRRSELRWLLVTLLPLVPAALFFALQWDHFGWVLYPEHIGMITWDAKDIIYKAKAIYTRIFEEQGAIVLTYAACFGGPLLWKAMPRWRGVLTVLLLVAAIKVLWGRWPTPFIPVIPTVLLCLGLVLLLFFRHALKLSPDRARTLGVIFLFITAYWSFCSLNFYTDRYLLCLVPLIAIAGTTLLWQAFEDRWPWAFMVVMAVALAAPLAHIGRDGSVGDTKLSYITAVRAQRDLVHHCEARGYHDRQFHGSFMDRYYMNDTTLGYLAGGRTFPYIADTLAPATSLAIVGSTTPRGDREMLLQQGFTSEARFGDEAAWCELLTRPANAAASAHP